MIEDKSDILKFEEELAPEHFLKVTVAELCNQIDVVKIVYILPLGDKNLYHLDDVGMLTILQQNNLPQNSPRLGQRLEQINNLLNGYVGIVALSYCLCHIAK